MCKCVLCVCARLYVAYLTGQATIYGAFAWTETERERKRDRHTYTHTHSHTLQLWFIFDFDYKQSNNLPHPETVPMGPTCCSYCCCCPAQPFRSVCVSSVLGSVVFSWMSAGAFTITLSYNNIYVGLCAPLLPIGAIQCLIESPLARKAC